MNTGIYVSIHPDSIKKIIEGKKTCEFRNYIPRKNFRFLYTYVTTPTCALEYIIEIDTIIKYPQKLDFEGDGNTEFNQGSKAKYAFKINRVFRLENSIPLKILKRQYAFVPPQAYCYSETYQPLTNALLMAQKTLICKH